jgi:hypothetical protein
MGWLRTLDTVADPQQQIHSGVYSAAYTQRRIHSGVYTVAYAQRRIHSGRYQRGINSSRYIAENTVADI